MHKKTIAGLKFKRTLLATSFCLVQATCIQTAWSQEPEEVIVTGSRIRQNPVERTAPVQTSTAADIERAGEVSVGDYLQRLPISGSAINRTNNSSGNLGFPPDGGGIGAGASEIDLRYLTSKRVLVLVDGKRWVRGSSGSGVSGAVDLNTVPTAAIERIEVLQDGASAIYGSDAIAGVVNVITRKPQEGFELETNQGQYDDGDGYSQDYSLTMGARGARSGGFVTVAYTRQDAVFAGDRELTSVPEPGAPPVTSGSSGTPQGRFIYLDPRGDVNGDGSPDVVSITLNNGVLNNGTTLPIYNPANPASGDFHQFGTADRFNFQPYNYLVTPNRRTNVFAKTDYQISDDVTFTLTGSFTNRRSSNQAAPNPLFMGSDAGSGFYMDNMFIPANQPYNPFGIDLDGRTNMITIARRPLEAGPRIFDQTVDTWILSGTVDGEFKLGNRSMFWDVGGVWGRNDAKQQGHNIFNSKKLAQALGDPAACAAVPGCVPFNVFGGQGPNGEGSITPEMLQWATFTQNDQSEQELSDVFVNLSGELFDLPAGPFGYALGYEYRKETGSFTPDAAVQAGETADVPAAPTEGSVKVSEYYLELRAPLLGDLPAIEQLELSAAVRASDYDQIGSDTVFRGGLYWRVVPSLSVRASYSEGFRAPNIGELFNTGSRFDSNISDPCATENNPPANIQANCAALGVPPTFTQLNPQISVQTGGNPNLQPETSDTYTVGFAFSPSWGDGSFIEDFSIDVNYYNIKLEDAIQALRAQDQLDNCVATLDPLFCDGIVRGGGGAITAFANQLTNIGRIETDGFDWTVSLTTAEGGLGGFRFTWANTYLNSYNEFTPGPTGDIEAERAGTELGSPTRGWVRYKSSLITDWLFHDFTTTLSLRYLSKLEERCPDGLEAFCSEGAAGNTLGEKVYADLRVSWAPEFWDRRAEFAIGVQNLTDEEPDVCRTCDLANMDGTIYPIPGRFMFGRAAFKF
jgi:iron complex outermembrane receptor protein